VQWNSIRLELSRSRKFPNGSVARVFIVRLPLDGEGRIDRALLAGAPRRATACRVWSADPHQWGFVVIEEERLRLFSGRHKRYLTFEADVPALGGNATIEEKDGEKMEFRIVEVRRR
jgi:hypothetical protein